MSTNCLLSRTILFFPENNVKVSIYLLLTVFMKINTIFCSQSIVYNNTIYLKSNMHKDTSSVDIIYILLAEIKRYVHFSI